MNETEIRKYANLMEELGLTGLEITQQDQVVRLERTPAVAKLVEEPERISAKPAAPVVREGEAVCSPFVGVFYAAAAENAAPYVSIGDTVKKGQTLCMIEAMKMFNEITAEKDGTVSEICVSNGQMVEYGTELFRIRS